ncbi:hypothetical protein C8R44DRAFT_873945 [Mycena epipterygia]|nr:hypothetical protein C8R44DRAFT_873945 [Mycena epipterygia]
MQETPSAVTLDALLAFQLHRLASTFGPLLHLDGAHGHKDIASREGLDSYFGRNTLVPKFVHVAQAIATLSTPGQTNFAVMLGFTAEETHIFYCTDEGGRDTSIAIRAHLRAIWALLQRIRRTRNMPPSDVDRSVASADELLTGLCDLAYAFVASKALDRAKKWIASIDALSALLPDKPFERKLVNFMRAVAHSAAEAAKLRGQGQSDEAKLFNSDHWKIFRQSTMVLQDQASTREANTAAMENLERDFPKGFPMSFCLDKMLKVESAVLTLHDLAVSPRRGHIVQHNLKIHPVPLPARTTTTISFSNLKDYLPVNSDLEEFTKEMRDAGTSSTPEDVSVHSKVHPECQLVAWVAQNPSEVASEPVSVVPYVTCSKRHCFACFVWLQEFNRLGDPTLPHLAFDGCHGGLRPGWLPPSLEPSMQETMLSKISSRLDEEFDKHKHHKESSASTTSSDKPRTALPDSGRGGDC